MAKKKTVTKAPKPKRAATKAPKAKKAAAPKPKMVAAPKAKRPLIRTWVPDWVLDPRTKRLPPSVGPGLVVRIKEPTSEPPGGGKWVEAPPPVWLVLNAGVRLLLKLAKL